MKWYDGVHVSYRFNGILGAYEFQASYETSEGWRNISPIYIGYKTMIEALEAANKKMPEFEHARIQDAQHLIVKYHCQQP